MDQQAFQLLMARFDDIERQHSVLIEKQNCFHAENRKLFESHLAEDRKLQLLVERHSTYFGIFASVIPLWMGFILKKIGVI